MILPLKGFHSARFYLISFLLLSSFCSFSQNINPNWKQELNKSLDAFLKCTQSASEKNDCSNYIGESLKHIYKINDFYSQQSGRYMTVNEIASFIKQSNKWTLLGHSYEQTILASAQEYANSHKAVIAVYINSDGIGHIAIITPGELHQSGSWGMNVPSAVSFLPSDPEKSFVDKGLSFAFTKTMLKDLLIYTRKY